MMKVFIGFPQPAEHLKTLCFRRLCNANGLKPPLQCTVFLNILSVFLRCSGTNQFDLPSCKLRLEDVGSINGTFCGTCTDNGMQLINKENDFSICCGFLQAIFQPLFKVAPILGAGQQCRQI